jgi:single-strand DNA-binding protein
MYLNKALVIGNLTRDPEVKALPSGIKVTSFSVATNRIWKDKSGAKQESADYHNVVVFGRSAETAGQYLKKGSSVLVEGRMQTRSWEDKNGGGKKYRTEIVADRVQFGNRPAAGGATGGNDKFSAPADDASQKDAPPVDTIDYPEEEINPDDIPF